MNYCNTSLPTVAERNALTLTLLEQVTPLLRTYARSTKLDFDDLYQDASIKILTILDARIEQIAHLQEYIAVSVRNQVLDRISYCKRREVVSLDEPLLDDVSLTLADVLPSPYATDPAVVLLAQERLEELRSSLVEVKHYRKHRMVCELHETASAIVMYDEVQLQQAC